MNIDYVIIIILIIILFNQPKYTIQQQYRKFLESDNVKQMFKTELEDLKKQRNQLTNKSVIDYYDKIIDIKEFTLNNKRTLIKNMPNFKYLGNISDIMFNKLKIELLVISS